MGKQSRKPSSKGVNAAAPTVVEQAPAPKPSESDLEVDKSLTGQQMTALVYIGMALAGLYQASKGESYFQKPLSPEKRDENLAMLQLFYRAGILSSSWAFMTILLLWKANQKILLTFNIVYAVSPIFTSYLFYIQYTADNRTLPSSQNMLVGQMALAYLGSKSGIAPRGQIKFGNLHNIVFFSLSNIFMALVAAASLGFKPECMKNLDAVGTALWLKSFTVYGTSMALTMTFALLWLDPVKKRTLLIFMAVSTYFSTTYAFSNLPLWMTLESSTIYNSFLASAYIMFLGAVLPAFSK